MLFEIRIWRNITKFFLFLLEDSRWALSFISRYYPITSRKPLSDCSVCSTTNSMRVLWSLCRFPFYGLTIYPHLLNSVFVSPGQFFHCGEICVLFDLLLSLVWMGHIRYIIKYINNQKIYQWVTKQVENRLIDTVTFKIV